MEGEREFVELVCIRCTRYAPPANVKATASCLFRGSCQLYFGHPVERKPIFQAPNFPCVIYYMPFEFKQ